MVWNAQISGLGVACDTSIMPGRAQAKYDQLGVCPYFVVLDKQQLTGADLYYVSGVMTHDGTHYAPWFALQDIKGIL